MPTSQKSTTLKDMEHIDWFIKTTKGAALREVARVAEIPYATIGKQSRAGHFSAENVIRIALSYGVHPVTALIDTEYLEPHWAFKGDILKALREATEEQLAEEVLRRMKIPGAHAVLDAPIDVVVAERSNRLHGVSSTFDITKAVADSSPEEDWEGVEFD